MAISSIEYSFTSHEAVLRAFPLLKHVVYNFFYFPAVEFWWIIHTRKTRHFSFKMSMLLRFDTQGSSAGERSIEVKFYPCMPEILVNHTEHLYLKVTINVETVMHWGHTNGRIWKHLSFRFSVWSLVPHGRVLPP